ncbi:hypothetical protein MMC18_006546 [Xylographa bjoerkii]|nr:hypothetical protein [Xylographa bjoerkii]
MNSHAPSLTPVADMRDFSCDEQARVSFERRVRDWVQAGLMTPEQVTSRLKNNHINEKRCFKAEQVSSFDQVFDTLSSTEGTTKYWPKSTLVSFLTGTWPHSATDFAAGHMLCSSMLYHVAFPFPALQDISWTRNELYAAIVMMTKHQHKIIGGFVSQSGRTIIRSRNQTDRVRVFFKSLAKPYAKTDTANRIEGNSTSDEDDIDVLDVLAHTQPTMLGLAHVPEVFFQPLIQKLPRSPYVLLDSQVPSREFLCLLELLLPYVLNEQYNLVDIHRQQGHDNAAVNRCILSAFIRLGETGIRWQMFECVLANTMPRLLDSLDHLFQRFFQPLKKPALADTSFSTISSSRILTCARLDQLALFLPNPTYFHDAFSSSVLTLKSLIPVYISSAAESANLSSLSPCVLRHTGPSILLVSGTDTTSNVPVIFGAYIPMLWREHSSDGPAYFGSEDSLLFQLAPTHDVFLCTKPSNKKYAYMSSKTGLSFGDVESGPVSLKLDEALTSGTFTQQDEGEGPYQPSAANASRTETSWQVQFAIESVEVWAYDKNGLKPAHPSPFGEWEDARGISIYEKAGKDRMRSSLLCA